MRLPFCSLFLLFSFAAVTSSCGGGSSSTTTTLTTSGNSTTPSAAHVFIVMEENHSYSAVIGNSSMPYFNGLATSYGLATQYYANAHPSLPNYFEMTAGDGTSITGLAGDSYTGPMTQDNVVRALTAAGKSWKSYAESLPSAGYLGGDSGGYLKHHNPFAYFSDVLNDPAQAGNIVPFSQFATDLASGNLPDYAFIAPNQYDDAHSCPTTNPSCTDTDKLAAADQWLKTNIDPVIKGSTFSSSLLVIVFDEGDLTDFANGGGRVAAVIVSPQSKAGFQSSTMYQHQSTLRLSLKTLGVTDLPGDAATAPDMGEFFQ